MFRKLPGIVLACLILSGIFVIHLRVSAKPKHIIIISLDTLPEEVMQKGKYSAIIVPSYAPGI